MSTMTRTVFLVDDQPEFLDLARTILGGHPEITVVGEARSGPEALPMVRSVRPEAVIVDVQMPGMSGFEATRLLLEALPDLRIILISAYADPQYEPLARTVGAVGFLSKRAFSAGAIARLLG